MNQANYLKDAVLISVMSFRMAVQEPELSPRIIQRPTPTFDLFALAVAKYDRRAGPAVNNAAVGRPVT